MHYAESMAAMLQQQQAASDRCCKGLLHTPVQLLMVSTGVANGAAGASGGAVPMSVAVAGPVGDGGVGVAAAHAASVVAGRQSS
jgi:hypothetical protein